MTCRFSVLTLDGLEKDADSHIVGRFVDGWRDYPPLTLSLLASFVLVHGFTGFWDWHHQHLAWWYALVGERSDPTLVLCGARALTLVRQGQLWRLVTAGFLHGDALHLLVNSLAGLGLGRLVEVVYGPGRSLWLFLLCVMGGNIAAQLGGSPLSFGASGGLFGPKD